MAKKCAHCRAPALTALLQTEQCLECGQETNADGTPAPEKRRFFFAADQARYEANRKRYGNEEALRMACEGERGNR